MKHELYIAVTEALIPKLVEMALAMRDNPHKYDWYDNRPRYKSGEGKYNVTLDLEKFKRFDRKKKPSRELAGEVRNCIVLFCRNSVERITQDDRYDTVTLQLYSGSMKLAADRRKLRIDEREYVARELGLPLFLASGENPEGPFA